MFEKMKDDYKISFIRGATTASGNSVKEIEELEKNYDATLTQVMDKQVIDGVVVAITDREVVIDINFKSDGVVSFNEFKYNQDLSVGDTVEVLVEKQEDKKF